MGFYDTPLVIRGDGWGNLTSGKDQLYTLDELQTLAEKYERDSDNFAGGNFALDRLNNKNPTYSVLNTPGTGNFYQDPNTGNIYTNKVIDFENNQVTYDPYLNIEDLSNDAYMPYLRQRVFYNSPNELKALVDLRNSNPQAYQQQAASGIADMGFNLWQGNSPYASELISQLETIKDVNPTAYYNADIALKAKQMGHNAANGAPDRNAPMQQDIQDMYSNAVNSGLSPQYIDSIINQNFQNTAADRSKTNAVNKASGGAGFNFKTDMLPGLKLVGSALLGAYGAEYLGAAGTAAEGANAGAGAIDSTAAAYGGSGGGGAFVPAAGSGASFSVAPGAYTTAGLGSNTGLMGPTYGELGYTGVEGGLAGPTYQELGYTGLNQSEAINAADAASKGITGKDVLDYANKARQTFNNANSLSKLLSGNSAGSATSNASNTSQEQIANYLRGIQGSGQYNGYLGQIKANQTPFFGSNQGTLSGENVYDLSGANSMANALRKA